MLELSFPFESPRSNVNVIAHFLKELYTYRGLTTPRLGREI